MTDIAANEPLEITAGDSVQWKRQFSDYPASDSWILSYAMLNATDKITITGAASGSDHLVTLAAADTAVYTAGTYHWQAYVTRSTERHLVDSGTLIIKPNFAAATVTTLDARSHVKKVLDAIEAVIEKRATIDQEEYTIGNRSLKRTPIEDLVKLKQRYQGYYNSEVAAERIKNGLPGKNRILVRI